MPRVDVLELTESPRRAERATARSEETLRALSQNAPVASFQVDRDGRALSANGGRCTRRTATACCRPGAPLGDALDECRRLAGTGFRRRAVSALEASWEAVVLALPQPDPGPLRP